jgi:hypothetical protein
MEQFIDSQRETLTTRIMGASSDEQRRQALKEFFVMLTFEHSKITCSDSFAQISKACE